MSEPLVSGGRDSRESDLTSFGKSAVAENYVPLTDKSGRYKKDLDDAIPLNRGVAFFFAAAGSRSLVAEK